MDLAAYVDEEDCLGFKIWVAELELIVGGSRGNKKADPAQVFLLLQKLVVTLERTTDRSEIREYQRRAEDALIDILLKGAPPPVRRLVCEALSKLYARGDQLPLFSRMSSLQLFLGTREAAGKETSVQIRLGALELMAALYYSQGRSLSIGVLETAAMAVKYCGKGADDATRRAALRLLAAAVEGVGGGHRGAAAVQQEVLRAVEKLLKERELGEPVRRGIADALRAVAAVGGAALWAGGLAGYEVARAACIAGLDDPSGAVRAGYARALGELVTAAGSPAAMESTASTGPKAKAQAAQGRALSVVREQCLSAEFAEAASASNRRVCTALAQAWVHHLSAVRLACGVDEAAFLDPALRPLEALAAACVQAGAAPEKGLSGTESELGAGISGGERPHAQACMLYIMRAGVLEQLGEAGQRLLLAKLTALLATDAPVATPVGVVALELVALLAEALGEVGPEAAAALEPAVAGRLVGPHAALRLQAASALAALAVAEPGSAARLMGSTLSRLRAAADALVEAAAAGPDKSRPASGTPRGVGSGRLKVDMNALHGWALGAAALVAASPRLPLGLPSHYVRVAAQIAAALVEAPRCHFAAAACLEREAGYVLLGALCQVAPAELTAACGGDALAAWAPALGAEATAVLDAAFKGNASNYLEHTLAAELWWRTAALQSLVSFIQGVVGAAPAEEQARLAGDVAGLLRHVLRLLPSHVALQDPARCKGGPGSVLAGASATLQLRLLQAYSALPSAAAYAADHEALSALCLGAVGAAAAAGSAELVLPALRDALDERDDSLGPWNFGGDPLERALLSFQGAAGGPLGAAWHAGLRAGVGYAMDAAAVGGPRAGGGGAYPQPQALAPALYAAQASLMGSLLRAVPPPAQGAIMDGLLSISRSVPPARKEKGPGRRVAALLAAATPALAGLGAASPLAPAAAPALTPLLASLAQEVAAEAAGGPALQRAAADLYAAAARLSEDAAALQLVRQLCREAAETPSLPRRAALALAVGGASRAVGGLGLAAVVPVAAQTLTAVAAASSAAIAPWVLQALLSCANAAGLAFVPQVRPALGLAQAMLLSEEIYSTPGLLPAVGRLANALVAALGPDYVLGSAAYDACRSVVSELRAPDTGGVRRPEDSLAAALESVLYAQMLVLFAPRALPAAQHVAVLVGTLPSRQPQLRKAAADTLRHLAERDAPAVLEERVEPALLAALDSETDPATAAQLQATLLTLLEAGAPLQPSRWVALCSEVITAAGPADQATGGVDLADTARNGGGGGDDDDGFFSSSGPAPAMSPPAAAPAAAATPAAGPAAGGGQAAVTPRLRTRVFAARCLLEVPALACSADRRHADLAAAQADPAGGDWLVERVQSLVDLAFRMVSGQLESLRPLGVELMLCVLAHLGDSADPLAEGERLLALYQAQYVSTLRASLAPGASPALHAAGAALAAAFLDKGLAGGDAVVLDRLLGLLCAPLAAWAAGGADAAQGSYAEWVAAGARVALLEAHAHCAVLAARLQRGSGADDPTRRVVVRAQGPFLTLLVECWIGLLHDHVVLSTQPAAEAYRLGLYGRLGADRAPALALVAAGIGPALRRAWPVALEAAACTLTHDRTSAYGAAGRERHAALLDLALAGLAEASSAVAAAAGAAAAAAGAELHPRAGGRAGTGLAELNAALHALRRLTAQRFAQEGWLGAAIAAECAAAVLRVLRTVLAPLAASLSFDAVDVACAVEAAAVTAHQLAFAAGAGAEPSTQGDLLAAADECIALSGPSSAALAAALGIFSAQLTAAAAGGGAAYVALLHRSLAAGAAAVRRGGSAAQLAAAVAHVAGVAKCAALHEGRDSGGAGGAGLPSAAQVLSAAAVTAAQQAERAAAGARAAQAGAGVGCLLALGAVATGTPASADTAEQPAGSAEAGGEWGGGWEESMGAPLGADHPPAAALPRSPAQHLCLGALRGAVGSASPAVRLQALLALRAYLQSLPPPLWAAQCAAAALPSSAAAVHAAMLCGASLSDDQEVQAAAEALKIGLLACNLGGGVGAASLAVVVPLLVETAAPPGALTPTLAELAVKLLTALASGPVASAFRGSVASLPPKTKQRLQGALQAAASGGGPGGVEGAVGGMQAGGQAVQPPSIQLRAFGGLKKPTL